MCKSGQGCRCWKEGEEGEEGEEMKERRGRRGEEGEEMKERKEEENFIRVSRAFLTGLERLRRLPFSFFQKGLAADVD